MRWGGLITAAVVGALAWAPACLAAYAPPRLSDGKPSLEGVWSNASITTLNRPAGVTQAVVDRATAEAIVKRAPIIQFKAEDADPVDVTQRPPADADPGAYDSFWIDPGAFLEEAAGGYRTSWVVDPADGQAPYSDAARARARQVAIGREGPNWDGPEALEPADRCLISSRGSSGPGMLNNVYNSHYQIVQTPGAVVIVVEMIHDARIIPIFKDRATAQAGHRPAVLAPWMGDSTAWWEGDTLVVETVHVHPEQGREGPIFLSPKGRVTERFTRVADSRIRYQFIVQDGLYYTAPWRAEMSFHARAGQLYEYACHEGNYALPGILSGARRLDPAAAP